jgi:hypothetical protein
MRRGIFLYVKLLLRFSEAIKHDNMTYLLTHRIGFSLGMLFATHLGQDLLESLSS